MRSADGMSFLFVLLTSDRYQDLRSGRREQRQIGDRFSGGGVLLHTTLVLQPVQVGLLVIDCDIPRGADPPQWRLLGNGVEVAGHRLPRTFSVRTPSGGLHLYFSCTGSTAWQHGRQAGSANRYPRCWRIRGWPRIRSFGALLCGGRSCSSSTTTHVYHRAPRAGAATFTTTCRPA